MNKRVVISVLGAGILLLAGCSGGGQGDTASSEAVDARAPAAGSGAGAGSAPRPPAGEPDTGTDRDASGVPIKLRPSERDIIFTADLRVRAGNVNQAAAQAKQQVAAAGGHVADENSMSEPGIPATVTITFKIPSERYQPTLDQLSNRLGTRLSLRQQAEDVTEQIADVDSRLRSAEAALSSYRRLLSRADSIGEVLSVEKEITQRETDLEALQARQKALSAQTRFATVTLRLESTPPAKAGAKPDDGFLDGLRNGWHALAVFAGGLATVVGWLLPFLAVGAVVAVPGRLVWRAVRRRRAVAPAPAGPDHTASS